ncbi:MAG: hypothetical protein J0I98_12240 [Mesorhizobium sp.]|nr:hypothetical protein [Mesorhizobium sp.]MBN9243551.1 hypothetical protein [Mesorhizobium sp.]
MFDPCRISGSRSLHERKLATWALLIGETHSSAAHAEVRRRPHRGMLPDVDFSRAVPDYSRPSLVRRLMRLVRRDGGKGKATADAPVGEASSLPYIGRDKQAAPGDSSGAAGHDVFHARAA